MSLKQFGFFHKRSHDNPLKKLRELLEKVKDRIKHPLIVLPEAIDGKVSYPLEVANLETQNTTNEFFRKLQEIANECRVFLLTGLYAWYGNVGLSSAYLFRPNRTPEHIHIRWRALTSVKVDVDRYRPRNPIRLESGGTKVGCLICEDCYDKLENRHMHQAMRSERPDIIAVPAASAFIEPDGLKHLSGNWWIIFANSHTKPSWIRGPFCKGGIVCDDNEDRLVIWSIELSNVI